MFEVGDIVLHDTNICTVVAENPIVLAANDGTTKTNIKEADLSLVASYKDVLAAFTRSLLCI